MLRIEARILINLRNKPSRCFSNPSMLNSTSSSLFCRSSREQHIAESKLSNSFLVSSRRSFFFISTEVSLVLMLLCRPDKNSKNDFNTETLTETSRLIASITATRLSSCWLLLTPNMDTTVTTQIFFWWASLAFIKN